MACGTQAVFILGLRVFRPQVVRRSECRVLTLRIRDAALCLRWFATCLIGEDRLPSKGLLALLAVVEIP
jgi:hypothetical protein